MGCGEIWLEVYNVPCGSYRKLSTITLVNSVGTLVAQINHNLKGPKLTIYDVEQQIYLF